MSRFSAQRDRDVARLRRELELAFADLERQVNNLSTTVINLGPFTPAAHAPTHESGGSDEIDVTGLSGLLADPQTPLGHASTHVRGGSDEINGDHLDIDFSPANYTPSTAPSEADNVDDLAAHLAGIDDAIGGIGGGVTDHGALAGLADDDHTQYLLATGTRNGGTAGTQTFENAVYVDGPLRVNNGVGDATFELTKSAAGWATSYWRTSPGANSANDKMVRLDALENLVIGHYTGAAWREMVLVDATDVEFPYGQVVIGDGTLAAAVEMYERASAPSGRTNHGTYWMQDNRTFQYTNDQNETFHVAGRMDPVYIQVNDWNIDSLGNYLMDGSSSNQVTLVSDAGSDVPYIQFGDGSETNVVGTISKHLPANYAGNGLLVEMWVSGTVASAGAADMICGIERQEVGHDINGTSWSGNNAFTGNTMSGTIGVKTLMTCTFSDGADMNNLAAGEPFRIRIIREHSDAYTGSVNVHEIRITEQV